MASGMGWIAYGRAAAEPRSVVVGLAALVAALVVLSAAAKVQRDRAAA